MKTDAIFFTDLQYMHHVTQFSYISYELELILFAFPVLCQDCLLAYEYKM